MAETANKTSPEVKLFRQVIGSKLAEIRQERRLTIEQVAEQAGLSKSAISSIEDGRWTFNTDMLQKFSKALKFDIVFEMY